MEENFEALLEMYMNEEEINEKIKSDNKEIKEEEKNNEKVSESKKDIRKYKEYAISMNEFLSKYLKMNTHKLRTATLSHKDLKYLTIGNPLVVGIYNGYIISSIALDCSVVLSLLLSGALSFILLLLLFSVVVFLSLVVWLLSLLSFVLFFSLSSGFSMLSIILFRSK